MMAETLQELADAVGRSKQAVHKWTSDPRWTERATAPFDVAKIRDWIRRNLRPDRNSSQHGRHALPGFVGGAVVRRAVKARAPIVKAPREQRPANVRPWATPEARRQRAAWRAANPERVREYQRRYRMKHRPQIAAQRRAWGLAHPGVLAERKRRYRVANPAAVIVSDRKYRERNRDEMNRRARERYRRNRREILTSRAERQR